MVALPAMRKLQFSRKQHVPEGVGFLDPVFQEGTDVANRVLLHIQYIDDHAAKVSCSTLAFAMMDQADLFTHLRLAIAPQIAYNIGACLHLMLQHGPTYACPS